MAPEVLGLGRDRNGNRLPPYSVAVDIWAIGIITVELLLKRVLFSSLGDIADYCYNREPINLDGANDVNISSTCRDFVGKLLLSDPSARPTAGATKNHPWLAAELQLIEEQEDIIDEEESLVFQRSTLSILLISRPIGYLLKIPHMISHWPYETPQQQLHWLGRIQQLPKH